MATEIKTLGSGVLKTSADAVGERVLCAAAHPLQPVSVVPRPNPLKTALFVTSIRLFNTDSVPRSIELFVVRFDPDQPNKLPESRATIRVLGYSTVLAQNALRVETAPLVLEEGDLLVGHSNVRNFVNYVISGIEREVS